MNDQKSWDQTLVKKFSSSNHFKLLNQLKNEVIKYPLNKKKNIKANFVNDNKLDNKSDSNNTLSPDSSSTKNSINSSESTTIQSSVSFNNSKNFSIYKNAINDSTNDLKDCSNSDQKLSTDDLSSSNFKDRLNQIDMK